MRNASLPGIRAVIIAALAIGLLPAGQAWLNCVGLPAIAAEARWSAPVLEPLARLSGVTQVAP